MNQSEIVLRVFLCWWSREDLKIRIGESSSLLPSFDAVLGAGSKKNAGLLGAVLPFGFRTDALHVVAPNLMLRTVAAVTELVMPLDRAG